jgi:3-ketosteroid 9alpha-monooxygenase subunit A
MNDYIGYPRGWFVVCFSAELAVGQTRAMKYFGKDLAAYRGEDGVVRVLDAFCPHLGAHLAIGGKVEGCELRCPFHAWKFGTNGQCVEIPYSKAPIPAKAKVGAWQVKEQNGFVMVHHDPTGAGPQFDIPPIAELDTGDWLPWTTAQYFIRTHPREIVENMADRAHFPRVHATEVDQFDFTVDAHTCTQTTKGRAFFEGNRVDPFGSVTTYHGPGYLLMRMNGQLQNFMLIAHTPIDETSLDLRMAVTIKVVGGDKEKTKGFVGQYVKNLKDGFEDDIKIWENKVFRDKPLLIAEDGPIGNLRRWYKQFYQQQPQTPSAQTSEAQP